MKKVIFLLNIGDYAPEITKITYPLIYYYANKIGAEVYVIKTRKWPDFPPVYEKLQIYYLAREMKCEWAIYIDSDALISPDCIDFTLFLPKNTVAHNGCDFANTRWKYDKYFFRDSRNISSCNWFTIASEWCLDLWRPLDDLTCEEAIANICPLARESTCDAKIDSSHLIDDYTLSRNIAKYGLHFTTIMELNAKLGIGGGFFHLYTETTEEKIKQLKETLLSWKVPSEVSNYKVK